MARPIKQGLDYFSFDTDFWHDRKIKQLRRSFGDKGVTVFLYLLCEIYRDKGYYITHNEDLIIDAANELGIADNLVVDIIKSAIGIGLFDKNQFDENNVLTSARIQENYSSAKRRPDMSGLPFIIEEETEVIEAETPVIVTKTRVIATKTPVSATIIPDYDSYVPEKTERFSPAFIQLIDDIGVRFKTDARCYATQLEKLLRDIHAPGVDGLAKVREGLKRLDTAEAIKTGKVDMTVTKFLRVDVFLKLLSGDYDVIYGSPDSNPLNLPKSQPTFRNSKQGKPPIKMDDLY